ncbi:hypothetical protein ACE6H2_020511 [Prunus campanulata]
MEIPKPSRKPIYSIKLKKGIFILQNLRHPRKDKAALALKPGVAKALRRPLRMFLRNKP